AAVTDSRQGNGSSEAVLARAAAAIERGRGTDETIVVQRLYHGNAGIPAGVVGGRRHLEERVVEMHDVRPRAAQRLDHPALEADRPHRVARGHQRAKAVHGAVLGRERRHLVAVLAQQSHLGAEDLVLPAGLLVIVVDDQDAHRHRSSNTGIAPTAIRSPAARARVTPASVRTRWTRQACGAANSLLAFGFHTIHASLPPSRVTWQVHTESAQAWPPRSWALGIRCRPPA